MMQNQLQAPPQQANPLDQLAGVTLGEPISWWPLAWGWWVLIALSLIAIGFGIRAYIRHRKRTLRMRQALQDLADLDQHANNFMQEAHAVLKGCVIAYWPKHQVASLNNQQWAHFLHDSLIAKGKQSEEQASSLSQAIASYELSLYASAEHAQKPNAEDVVLNITQWIKLATPPKQSAVQEAKHV